MSIVPSSGGPLVTGAVITLFTIWLGLTVINSTTRGYTYLGRIGPLHDLVPKWNFFAPKPGTHDYYLLYRDQFVDGTAGYWREAPGLSEPRPWYAPIWNPDKFVPKALFDLVQDLIMQSAAVANSPSQQDECRSAEASPETDPASAGRHGFLDTAASQSLQITMPYIVLLHYISQLPRSELSVGTQFAVIQRSAYDETTEPVFISEVHELD